MDDLDSVLAPVAVRAGLLEETEAVVDVVLRAFEMMRPLLAQECWSELIANIRLALSNFDGTFNQTAWSGMALTGGVAYSGPNTPRNGFPSGWSHIRALGVESAYCDRGVGRLLVQSCIDQACKDQASAIGLYTADINTGALCLYKGLGFVPCSNSFTKYGLSYRQYALKI